MCVYVVSFIMCCHTVDIIYNMYNTFWLRKKPRLWVIKQKCSANAHASRILSIVCLFQLNIREADLMLKMEIRAISQDFVTLLLNFESYEQLYEVHGQDNLSPGSQSLRMMQSTLHHANTSDSDDNDKLLELIDSSFDGDISTWGSGCNTESRDRNSKQVTADTATVVPPGGQYTEVTSPGGQCTKVVPHGGQCSITQGCDTRVLPPGAQHRHDCLLQDISSISVAPNASSHKVANSPIDQPVQLNSTAIDQAKHETRNVECVPVRLYHTPGFNVKHCSSDTLSSADESTPIVNIRTCRYTRSGCEDSTPTMTEESLCRLPFTDRHISGFCSTDWLQGTQSSDDSQSDPEGVYLDKTESDEDHPITSSADRLDRITSSLEATRDSEPNLSLLTTPSSEGTKSDVTSSSIHFSPATSCVESSYKESDGGASCSTSPHSDTRCRLHRVLQRNISRERLMARMARQRYLVSSSTGLSSDSVNDMPPPTNSPIDISTASNDSVNKPSQQAAQFGTRPPCIGKEATPEGINKSTNGTSMHPLHALADVDISDVFADQFIIPAECKYNNAYGINFIGVTTQHCTPKRQNKMYHKTRTASAGRAVKRKTHLASSSATKKPALLRRLQNWGRQLRNGSRYNPAQKLKVPDSNMKEKDAEVEEEL